jgi:hypothetical protein
VTFFVHEFPGPAFRFTREIAVAEPRQVAAAVAAAFDALASVMVPLTIELELDSFDPELGIRRYDATIPHHRRALAARSLPAAVVVRPAAESVTTIDALTPSHIEAWLAEQLTSDGNHCIGIAELITTVTEARARACAAPVLRTRSGDTGVPARAADGDAAWLTGPIAQTPSQPPLRLTIHHDLNELELTLGVEWSWWSEGPGRADLDAAMRDVSARGWIPRQR